MKRYPLGSVLDHRQRETDRRAMEHAEAIVARDSGFAALERVRARTRQLEQRLAGMLAVEEARADSEQVRAVDLAHAEAFRREATRRIDVSRALEKAAEGRLQAAITAEDAARASLARSRGDERAVREHEARFVRDERRREDERETEDVLASGAYRSRFA